MWRPTCYCMYWILSCVHFGLFTLFWRNDFLNIVNNTESVNVHVDTSMYHFYRKTTFPGVRHLPFLYFNYHNPLSLPWDLLSYFIALNVKQILYTVELKSQYEYREPIAQNTNPTHKLVYIVERIKPSIHRRVWYVVRSMTKISSDLCSHFVYQRFCNISPFTSNHQKWLFVLSNATGLNWWNPRFSLYLLGLCFAITIYLTLYQAHFEKLLFFPSSAPYVLSDAAGTLFVRTPSAPSAVKLAP